MRNENEISSNGNRCMRKSTDRLLSDYNKLAEQNDGKRSSNSKQYTFQAKDEK